MNNPHILLLIYTLLVSFSFHVGHSITNDIDPLVLTFTRFALGSMIFAVFVGRKYGIRILSVGQLFRYSLISASLVTYFIAMFYALRYTSAVNGGVLYTFTPLFTTLYGFLFLRQNPGVVKVLVLFVIMLGAVWVVIDGNISNLLNMKLNRGDWLFLGGTMSMGMFPVLSKLFAGDEPAPVMTFWTMFLGALILMLLANVKIIEMDWAAAPVRVYLGIGYVTVFTTVITFFIIQYTSRVVPVSQVMAYVYLSPVFVAVENVVMGEPLPSFSVFCGIAVVAVGTFYFMKSRGAN